MNGTENEVAALLAGLEVTDKAKIRAAADALIARCAEAPDFAQALERALSDGQRRNRWALAYVLGHLPRPSGAAIHHLLASLDHRDPDIRWAIALLLIKLAKSKTDITLSLMDLCRTGTVNQKRMSLYCIRDLNLDDEATLQALLAGAHDHEPTVRVAAVISLKTRRDAGDVARRKLLELFLNDVDLRVRNASAVTLAQLGAPSEDFMAALRAAENGANPQLQKTATAALSLLLNFKK